MDTVRQLLQTRIVLIALWAFVRALISWIAPNLPQPVLASADSLVAAVIAVVAVADARGRVNQVNARRMTFPPDSRA